MHYLGVVASVCSKVGTALVLDGVVHPLSLFARHLGKDCLHLGKFLVGHLCQTDGAAASTSCRIRVPCVQIVVIFVAVKVVQILVRALQTEGGAISIACVCRRGILIGIGHAALCLAGQIQSCIAIAGRAEFEHGVHLVVELIAVRGIAHNAPECRALDGFRRLGDQQSALADIVLETIRADKARTFSRQVSTSVVVVLVGEVDEVPCGVGIPGHTIGCFGGLKRHIVGPRNGAHHCYEQAECDFLE